MAFVTDEHRQRIRAAIEAAELRTRGEFVTVIARESDDYLYIPILWAALISLAIPGLAQLSLVPWLVTHTYSIQVVAFVLIAVLFRLPAIKHRLIPKYVQRQRAHQIALEQFFLQNLHGTAERTGVLLFVSVAEHYVEIIADKGINERVGAGAWDALVAQFVTHVKQGRVAEGFVRTIEACGDLLEAHFPAGEGDRNELPDRLIELP
jgi:putative membrane protein